MRLQEGFLHEISRIDLALESLAYLKSSQEPEVAAIHLQQESQGGIVPRASQLQELFGVGRVAGFSFATGPAEFWVREADAGRARELLAGLTPPSDEEGGPG